VDLEEVRACSDGLYRRIAVPDEWALAADADRQSTFFRFWTAKEAVLKIGGEGIKDLGRCRIARIVGPSELRVDYTGREWVVDQVVFAGHVAAVATAGLTVQWVLPQGEGFKGSRGRGVE
jgi:4'-phosphopantetheinyl transferase